jgi:molybdopterin-guanine dinucleotide biosynthesis protein A
LINRTVRLRPGRPSLGHVNTDVLGAVLTGGRSTRMGRDKSDVLVDGDTMLDRVTSALTSLVGHIVLLGPDRDGWVCWPDSVHTQGPLAGVATALRRTETQQVLVVAVDHAFVRSATLSELVSRADGLPVVPVDDAGVRQVTCAVYPRSIAEAAAEEAALGGTVQTLLDRVSFRPVIPQEWRSWGEDGRSWFSVDSEDALASGLANYGV